jgi:hypothetical protein
MECVVISLNEALVQFITYLSAFVLYLKASSLNHSTVIVGKVVAEVYLLSGEVDSRYNDVVFAS